MDSKKSKLDVVILKLSICGATVTIKEGKSSNEGRIVDGKAITLTIAGFIVIKNLMEINQKLSKQEFSEELYKLINDFDELKSSFDNFAEQAAEDSDFNITKDELEKNRSDMYKLLKVKMPKEFVYGMVNSVWPDRDDNSVSHETE